MYFLFAQKHACVCNSVYARSEIILNVLENQNKHTFINQTDSCSHDLYLTFPKQLPEKHKLNMKIRYINTRNFFWMMLWKWLKIQKCTQFSRSFIRRPRHGTKTLAHTPNGFREYLMKTVPRFIVAMATPTILSSGRSHWCPEECRRFWMPNTDQVAAVL